MKSIVVHPFGNIPSSIHSHKGAQGYIFADQLGAEVATKLLSPKNFDSYDSVYVYHGNDFSGGLNVFGGIEFWSGLEYIRKLARYKGKIYSINIDFPKYSEMILSRLERVKEKGKPYSAEWDLFPWEALKSLENRAITRDPNFPTQSSKLAFGDSHAISMYRPGWINVSVPYSTLYGSIKKGFEAFIPDHEFSHMESYFGNIDIRHHLMRQENPKESASKLAIAYVNEAVRISNKYDCEYKIWEPLPIENESRKIPKSGWYKGKPFYGSWKERNDIRNFLWDCVKLSAIGTNVKTFEWIKCLQNTKNELDFIYMEKPRSVHLSRSAYPLWKPETTKEVLDL